MSGSHSFVRLTFKCLRILKEHVVNPSSLVCFIACWTCRTLFFWDHSALWFLDTTVITGRGWESFVCLLLSSSSHHLHKLNGGVSCGPVLPPAPVVLLHLLLLSPPHPIFLWVFLTIFGRQNRSVWEMMWQKELWGAAVRQRNPFCSLHLVLQWFTLV